MRDRFVAVGMFFALACLFALAELPACAASADADRTGLSASDNNPSPAAPILLTAGTLPEAADARLSDAQRITRLQRTLDSDQKHLGELKADLANLEKEYQEADADFKQLDGQLDARRQADGERKAGSTPDADAVRAKPSELTAKWDLAKQRFELAIRQRKALQTSIATLEAKMASDRQALDVLLKPADPAADIPSAVPGVAAEANSREAAPAKPAAADAAAAASVDSQVVTAIVGSMIPTLTPLTVPAMAAEPSLNSLAPVLPSEAKSNQLTAAEKEAKKKSVVAQQAQVAAQSATERAEILDRYIVLERTLLETAQGRVANIESTLASIEADFHKKLVAGVAPAELAQLRQQITEAKARLREAQAEVAQHNRQLDDLHSELANVHAEQIAALEEAEQRRAEARGAENHLKDLLNPLAWANVEEWFQEHSSRIACILVSLASVLWLFRRIEARLITLLARRAKRNSAEDRENRSRTLIGVVHNAAGVFVFAGGIVMLLNEAGIVETGRLLSWLAIIGFAVAFGAQALVKDFFSGFMILLEQQYMVNDVVQINDVSGQVERITLRMTVLRDWEGRLHFIPHGEINRVSNSTQGWSRAVFNVGVGYGENIDHVMHVLAELAREMRRDPEFVGLILEDPEILGVEELGESSVVVRFVIKTRPLKKWIVRREMLRRIKNKFDEVGIEFPYPTRTLIHRGSADESLTIADEEPTDGQAQKAA
ncbi:MAG TPA: mechanosensitive ion channel domain-containing protein [Pirellulales bacterium]|nr:mechanosensitive ion channel domain-containing protein [Pirellulales bacterium]